MEVRPGYKQTEVGVIPEDWETKQIGKVCKLINGRGFKPHEWSTTGLPIIRIQNLKGSDEYNHYTGSYNSKIEVKNGQLLFAWSGSRGTSFGPHIWKGPLGLLNYHTWKVQLDQSENSKIYIYHALQQLTKYIEGKAHGASALVHTQKWEMESFLIPIPPTITEQQSIAEALSDADALIESLEQLIAKKRLVKQGAMQELLTGKRRLPGFGNSAGYKQTEVGVIPEDWEVTSLEDIGSIVTGSTPPTKDRSNYGDEYLFASPIDIGFAKYVATSEKKLSVKGYKISRIIPKNSILVVCIGSTIGKCGIALYNLTANQQINAIISNESVSAEYVYYVMLTMSKRLRYYAGEQAVPILNKSLFSQILIPLPPMDEQGAIATTLGDMDEEITSLEEELDKARMIKQGMMQELLTGRIRLV